MLVVWLAAAYKQEVLLFGGKGIQWYRLPVTGLLACELSIGPSSNISWFDNVCIHQATQLNVHMHARSRSRTIIHFRT